MILSADVGGTKCNLALFEREGDKFALRYQNRFASREYPNFSDLVAAFLSEAHERVASSKAGKILAAGFGVGKPAPAPHRGGQHRTRYQQGQRLRVEA